MSTHPPHDRVALVTGAGSGIGRATAVALLADGWRVVFSGRRLEALRESIARAGDPFDDIASRALAAPADVTRPESVADLFDLTLARFGRLDLLFNNAGVFTPGAPLEDLALEQWRAAVDTNLSGAFYCTQHAFRIMKSQSPRGGRIINNGSISAHAPRPRSTVAPTTSRSGRSTSATPRPSSAPGWPPACLRPTAASGPRRAWTCATPPTRWSTWRGCRWMRTCSS